jgi:hypothetical protein
LEEIRELKNVVVKSKKYERLQNLEMMRNASKKIYCPRTMGRCEKQSN